MYSLLLIGILAFCVAFILTPLCRNLAIRMGLVDQPDHIRKLHTRPVPRIGGISIFIAYLVSVALLFLFTLLAGRMIRDHLDVIRNLVPAATIVFFAGLLDDLVGLKAWQKFVAQVAASAVALWAGVQISGIAGHP